MQIDIQSSGFKLTPELRGNIQQQLNQTFRTENRRVRKIVVRLFDRDLDSGEKTNRCRVQTIAKGLPQVITERRSNSIDEATNFAIQSAHRDLTRRLRRLQQRLN